MPGNASTRAPHLAVDVCPAALPTSLSANPTWRRSRVLTAQAAFGFSPGLVVALGGFEQPATNLISPGRVALAANWVTNGTFNNIDTQATNARRFHRAAKVH